MAKKRKAHSKPKVRAAWMTWEDAGAAYMDLRGPKVRALVTREMKDGKEVASVEGVETLARHPINPAWKAKACKGEGPGEYDCGDVEAVVCSDAKWEKEE